MSILHNNVILVCNIYINICGMSQFVTTDPLDNLICIYDETKTIDIKLIKKKKKKEYIYTLM